MTPNYLEWGYINKDAGLQLVNSCYCSILEWIIWKKYTKEIDFGGDNAIWRMLDGGCHRFIVLHYGQRESVEDI